MSKFLKQRHQRDGGERGKVYWERTGQGEPPFRGKFAPLIREEEYESWTDTVVDCHAGTFDTSKPEQRIADRTYNEILDAWAAHWFKIIQKIHMEGEDANGIPVMHVYIEWAEPYKEVLPNKVQALGAMNEHANRGNGSTSKPQFL